MARRKKQTPVSDQAIKTEWPEFSRECLARLEVGKMVYGDSSFSREPLQLIGELKQELYDVSNWSFILFSRLSAIERALTEALHQTLRETAATQNVNTCE